MLETIIRLSFEILRKAMSMSSTLTQNSQGFSMQSTSGRQCDWFFDERCSWRNSDGVENEAIEEIGFDSVNRFWIQQCV